MPRAPGASQRQALGTRRFEEQVCVELVAEPIQLWDFCDVSGCLADAGCGQPARKGSLKEGRYEFGPGNSVL